MISEDWLGSYADLRGTAKALDRISMRFKRTNNLIGSVAEIERHYDCLESHFLEFFPQAIRFAKQYHRPAGAEPQNAAPYLPAHRILERSR
jgi:acyl carrier protein phosphodiesterase